MGGIHCHTDRRRPTAAGEGTWMPATEHGWRWLARWQSTTPSIRNGPRSSGRMSFSRLSMLWGGSKSSRYRSRAVNQQNTFYNVKVEEKQSGFHCCVRMILNNCENEAQYKRVETWCDRENAGCHTCRSCSVSASSSRSCSIFLLIVNWGSVDSTLLWLPRNTDTQQQGPRRYTGTASPQ